MENLIAIGTRVSFRGMWMGTVIGLGGTCGVDAAQLYQVARDDGEERELCASTLTPDPTAAARRHRPEPSVSKASTRTTANIKLAPGQIWFPERGVRTVARRIVKMDYPERQYSQVYWQPIPAKGAFKETEMMRSRGFKKWILEHEARIWTGPKK